MIHKRSTLFLNREHAAQQLISKLSNYKNKNCSIITTSNGGVAIAKHVAKSLNADLVFIPSEKIKDPSDSLKSIGVVSLDYVVTDELDRGIPQDFIYRRTRAIRSELLSRYPDVYSPISSRFQDRIVILVDDCLESNDEVLGCLRTVRKQRPKEIVVAVPVVSHDAAQGVTQEADSVVFIHVVSDDSIKSSYLDFDTITDEEVRGLMDLSTKEIIEDKPSSHNLFLVG
jgi:putative phosphoribosyl transferase